MSWQLHANFFDSPKFRAEDYAARFSYAIEKGWLIKEGEKIKLSVSGYQELP